MRGRALAQAAPATLVNLADCPIALGGDWDGSPTSAALIVIRRMREACLAGLTLVSDRQPVQLRVDNHRSGSPAVWLHNDGTRTAWAIVDIGARDWCKLSYQFGHELGHILSNSWAWTAKPGPPCQWLEESLVEAHSIRGLGILAKGWKENPPFWNDNAFGDAITSYRQNVVAGYARASDPGSYSDLADWFRRSRPALEKRGEGLDSIDGPAILAILAEYEKDQSCVEDLGALNCWPGRTRVPIGDYLDAWERSCAELGAKGRLPHILKERLGV